MCLLVVCYNALPDCPLLVFANRDERRSRPTEPPTLHDDPTGRPMWLGGQDVEHGGTWLGLNRFGLVVAVTNRPKNVVAKNLRSRGLLCRDLLECESVESAAAEAQRQMAEFEFAGFNLLLMSAARCVAIEAGDEPSTIELSNGVHVIANRRLDDSADPRVERAKQEIETRQPQWNDWRACFQSAAEICSLPATDELPGLCLTGAEWGTVSSTIVALPANASDVRYHYAPGPSCETSYENCSVDAWQLLQEPREGRIHRMHLRGPWEVEWILDTQSPPPRPSPRGGGGGKTSRSC